jgi:hypothetical protein
MSCDFLTTRIVAQFLDMTARLCWEYKGPRTFGFTTANGSVQKQKRTNEIQIRYLWITFKVNKSIISYKPFFKLVGHSDLSVAQLQEKQQSNILLLLWLSIILLATSSIVYK